MSLLLLIFILCSEFVRSIVSFPCFASAVLFDFDAAVVCVFKSSFILYSNWLFNSSISDRRSSFSSLSFFVAIIKLINIRIIIEGALKP